MDRIFPYKPENCTGHVFHDSYDYADHPSIFFCSKCGIWEDTYHEQLLKQQKENERNTPNEERLQTGMVQWFRKNLKKLEALLSSENKDIKWLAKKFLYVTEYEL